MYIVIQQLTNLNKKFHFQVYDSRQKDMPVGRNMYIGLTLALPGLCQTKDRDEGLRLILHDTLPSDSGIYTCVVTNQYGTMTWENKVDVVGT